MSDISSSEEMARIAERVKRAALLNPNAHLKFPIAQFPESPVPPVVKSRSAPRAKRETLSVTARLGITARLREYAASQYPQYEWNIAWESLDQLRVVCRSEERPGPDHIPLLRHVVTDDTLEELLSKGHDMINVAAVKVMEV